MNLGCRSEVILGISLLLSTSCLTAAVVTVGVSSTILSTTYIYPTNGSKYFISADGVTLQNISVTTKELKTVSISDSAGKRPDYDKDGKLIGSFKVTDFSMSDSPTIPGGTIFDVAALDPGKNMIPLDDFLIAKYGNNIVPFPIFGSIGLFSAVDLSIYSPQSLDHWGHFSSLEWNLRITARISVQ